METYNVIFFKMFLNEHSNAFYSHLFSNNWFSFAWFFYKIIIYNNKCHHSYFSMNNTRISVKLNCFLMRGFITILKGLTQFF